MLTKYLNAAAIYLKNTITSSSDRLWFNIKSSKAPWLQYSVTKYIYSSFFFASINPTMFEWFIFLNTLISYKSDTVTSGEALTGISLIAKKIFSSPVPFA